MRVRAVTLAAVLAVLAPGAAWAEAGDGELEVSRAGSGTFVLVGGLAYLLSETLFKDELAPDDCRWCDGADLNPVDDGVRSALVWDDPIVARRISDGTGYVGVPVFGMGLLALAAYRDDRSDQIIDDQLIVVEAAIASGLLNQAGKFLAGRERPFVRVLPEGEKDDTEDPQDNNLSFYSGHTSFTFSIAVASGTVASLRGYRGAWVIWTTGLTLATTTGYLRIAGDKHYFSDVMVGAVVGSFVGFAVPYWLHRVKDDGGTAAATSAGSALGAGWSGGGPVLSWSGTF